MPLKYGFILLVISIINYKIIECEQSLNEVLKEVIESDLNSSKIVDKNIESKSIVEKCPLNSLIDKLIENLLPNDYEIVERDVVYKSVDHINDTFVKLDRLQRWAKNISTNFDNVAKRIVARIIESVMLVDIEAGCRNSLVKIGNAIQHGEAWAIQCKLVIKFFV